MIPLWIFVWMLGQIPPPDPADEKERQKRAPMAAADRKRYFLKHAPILLAICLAYVLITLVRSLRADFAPELWKAFGMEATRRCSPSLKCGCLSFHGADRPGFSHVFGGFSWVSGLRRPDVGQKVSPSAR